jgi:hypothetical protein
MPTHVAIELFRPSTTPAALDKAGTVQVPAAATISSAVEERIGPHQLGLGLVSMFTPMAREEGSLRVVGWVRAMGRRERRWKRVEGRILVAGERDLRMKFVTALAMQASLCGWEKDNSKCN